MIRTYKLECELEKEKADALNMESGRIYSNIVSKHWKLLRQKGLWLSETTLTRVSDLRVQVRNPAMHAHSIDAAQQGFFKACKTTRALRKAGIEDAKFPWRNKKFRTTVWKNTAIKFANGVIRLSNGQGKASRRQPIEFRLPEPLKELKVLEVRLVYDKRARKYNWHIVAETGKQPKVAAGNNTVSVDLGEIHPAVVGDDQSATIITCRERRHEQQGHAKRLAKITKALSRKRKGSRRYKRLVRAKSRMKAKHECIMRDMEHKISKAIVTEAVERNANTIVMGDVRDIADGVDIGKKTNQKISGWNHGKIQTLVAYKAQAEGISVVLQDEHYTSQTCPTCGHKHKSRGRNYRCPSCGFSGHRDVVGQVNLLSAYKLGAPGKIQSPTDVKHRMPHNLRLMRRCPDTGQPSTVVAGASLGKRPVFALEAAGL